MAPATCARESLFSGTAVPKVGNPVGQRSLFGDAVLLVFVLAQCLDGIFTYVGVITFGPGIEANPVVAALMNAAGHGPGLIAAKSVAVTLGLALHLREVHLAVALLAGFYVFVAVLPWVAILFT